MNGAQSGWHWLPRAVAAVDALLAVLAGCALFALMLLTFNPLAPLRLRWMGRGLRPVAGAWLAPALSAHGLELQRRRAIGPVWSGRHALDVGGPREGGLTDGLRAASLWVARRREAGLTPLRNRAAGLAFRPGVSAG